MRSARFLLIAVLAACLASVPGAHAFSSLILKNATLSNALDTCTVPNATLNAYQALLFSNTEGVGYDARANYSQAYICGNGTALCGSVNPLQSASAIEANNSFIMLNQTGLYSNMSLVLNENNTWIISGSPLVSLDSSTVKLGANNWWGTINSSFTANNSRFELNDYFTSWATASNIAIKSSLFSTRDHLLALFSSAFTIINSTWRISSTGLPAPEGYTDTSYPLVFIHDSVVRIKGTYATVTNMSDIHVINSTLRLDNSRLVVRDSVWTLWNSSLVLNNSIIELHNSSIDMLCGSMIKGENIVSQFSPSGGAVAPAGLVEGSELTNLTEPISGLSGTVTLGQKGKMGTKGKPMGVPNKPVNITGAGVIEAPIVAVGAPNITQGQPGAANVTQPEAPLGTELKNVTQGLAGGPELGAVTPGPNATAPNAGLAAENITAPEAVSSNASTAGAEAAAAAPEASPMASPVPEASPMASPMASPAASPVPEASPVASASPMASPVPEASPMASPVPAASPAASPVPEASPVAASPAPAASPSP